jgi:hypothetical protein
VPGGGPVERGELSDELIDELLGGAQTAEQIAGPDGLLGQLTRRLLERALQAELSDHLGYAPGQAPPGGAGNARNGQPAKTLITDQGPVRVRSARDRKRTFDPKALIFLASMTRRLVRVWRKPGRREERVQDQHLVAAVARRADDLRHRPLGATDALGRADDVDDPQRSTRGPAHRVDRRRATGTRWVCI